MAKRINGPVGSWRKGALNRSEDVTAVQELLTAAAKTTKNKAFDPRGVDGGIARPPRKSATVKAIRAFQSTFMRSPDGVISPGKRTIQKLLKYDIGQTSEPEPGKPEPGKPESSEPKVASDCVFPLSFVPAPEYNYGGLSFGAPRVKGRRTHAGCDLIAPEVSKIYAVADGKITLYIRKFHHGTGAVVVEHDDFTVRYCEIKGLAKGLRRGSEVTCGQEIAAVGMMRKSSMLHFEMYKGTSSGSYTNRSNPPYERRDDLMNPTTYLNKWKTNLPTE
jgi:murein DD-endopeptidase MepM/ murein hydrolase activator NlpD